MEAVKSPLEIVILGSRAVIASEARIVHTTIMNTREECVEVKGKEEIVRRDPMGRGMEDLLQGQAIGLNAQEADKAVNLQGVHDHLQGASPEVNPEDQEVQGVPVVRIDPRVHDPGATHLRSMPRKLPMLMVNRNYVQRINRETADMDEAVNSAMAIRRLEDPPRITNPKVSVNLNPDPSPEALEVPKVHDKKENRNKNRVRVAALRAGNPARVMAKLRLLG